MTYKHGQRRLRSGGRPSLIGDGLFDRVRVASLALFGGMTAVGLAIVALAFNQSWPLIPGSAIPGLPAKHQTVGAAAIAARPAVRSTAVGAGRLARSGRNNTRPRQGSSVPSGGATAGANGPSATVVSQSTPVTSPQGVQHDQSSSQHHAPAVQRQGKTPTTVAGTPSTPEPAATHAPSTAPEASSPASSAPVTATVEPPEESESNLPPWSNGNGNAYGREEGRHGSESGDDDSQGHDD